MADHEADRAYLNPTYIQGLQIPFPTIQGVSKRQIWYAENLREAYIINHFERFLELEETMLVESDKRIKQLDEFNGDHCESMDDVYTDAEKACLLGVNAGGIIHTLLEDRDGRS